MPPGPFPDKLTREFDILMEFLNPVAADFILFCVRRRGNRWPALYDEMCRVAGQRLYKGLGYPELREIGLSLALTSLDDIIGMVEAATGAPQPQLSV